MRSWLKLALGILAFVASPLYAQGELRIKNLEIQPQPVGIKGSAIELSASRSYRFIVTIERGGQGQPASFPTFIVRSQCALAGGGRVVLGEARIGVTPHSGWVVYAAYDVYPSSAGSRGCDMQTIVDADNEVSEPDESATSNVWVRSVVIQP